MKKYFQQYKPFLIFLAAFFGCYIVLTFLYQSFLNSFDTNAVDTITQAVAQNSEKAVSWFFMRIQAESIINEPFVRIYFQNQYIVTIVEGCNGISVIILFISFIVAFSGSLKNTMLFIFGGTLLIYILNVLRIALLIVLMYYFPEEKHLLHNVLFPAIIYGTVFILWIIWVNKFSKYAK
ncbi:exosortase family protein XrtF [Flavobacterium sp. HJJ]|uniref:exosortase family protein XrtF n=1 Tax=Flavobacterium sp. HJJ TaxID=2783792 RepID=UPI00188D266E|nr:exosortase family protein XrtF [Flavobacterium sp. HJJ]MBF4472001.1 exosortase family protein XrtF [Flavobacterium sp. HJJ]